MSKKPYYGPHCLAEEDPLACAVYAFIMDEACKKDGSSAGTIRFAIKLADYLRERGIDAGNIKLVERK